MSLVCQKMFATRENVSGGKPGFSQYLCFSPQSHQTSMSAKRLHCVPTPQPHRIIRGGCPVVARTSVRLREIKVAMARRLAVHLYWMMRQGWDYRKRTLVTVLLSVHEQVMWTL